MNTRADKEQENKSQSITNAVSQTQHRIESTFRFIDNRPKAMTQLKLQEIANNSQQVMQLKAFQETTNNSQREKQATQLQALDNHNYVPQQAIVQRARIVQKPAVLGFHHWELQYGSSNVEDGLGELGQIGAISATEDRDAKGSSGKSGKLVKGKAMVRVVNKHISGYSKVGDLEDNTIDEKVKTEAEKRKGQSISFNQITNNCQDFVSGIWNRVGGTPDPSTHNERNQIINEFTRAPTPDEVAENLANSYMYM